MTDQRQRLNRLATDIENLFDLPEASVVCDYREPGYVCLPPEATEKILAETRASIQTKVEKRDRWGHEVDFNEHCPLAITFGGPNGDPRPDRDSLMAIVAMELFTFGTCFCVHDNTIYTTQRGADHFEKLMKKKEEGRAEEEAPA